MPRRIRTSITTIAACILVAATSAALNGCKAQPHASYTGTDIRARINPVEGEPATTVLTFDEDTQATTLFQNLNANTSSAVPRGSLAGHYARPFPISSAFFEATAAVARGVHAAPGPPWPISQAFRCESETGPESHRIYLTVWDRFAFAPPEQMPMFVEEADRAMRVHGHTCDLLVLWSKAVLREAEWYPDAVADASQEKAVRILLDVGETYTPLHEGEPSPELFLDLAGYFDAAKHDYVSAYVATRWAEDRLELAKKTPTLHERYRARIARYLAAYSARLPLAPQ